MQGEEEARKGGDLSLKVGEGNLRRISIPGMGL